MFQKSWQSGLAAKRVLEPKMAPEALVFTEIRTYDMRTHIVQSISQTHSLSSCCLSRGSTVVDLFFLSFSPKRNSNKVLGMCKNLEGGGVTRLPMSASLTTRLFHTPTLLKRRGEGLATPSDKCSSEQAGPRQHLETPMCHNDP